MRYFNWLRLSGEGLRVALMERGILRGRDQEWNISGKELDVFVELNLLTEEELSSAIATQYNPARVRKANKLNYLLLFLS